MHNTHKHTIPTQTSNSEKTHNPRTLTHKHKWSYTQITPPHTHIKKPHTNTCTQSLHAHQGSWFVRGVRICMAGQIFLVLNSNQLLYLSDTCLAKKKKKLNMQNTFLPSSKYCSSSANRRLFHLASLTLFLSVCLLANFYIYVCK